MIYIVQCTVLESRETLTSCVLMEFYWCEACSEAERVIMEDASRADGRLRNVSHLFAVGRERGRGAESEVGAHSVGRLVAKQLHQLLLRLGRREVLVERARAPAQHHHHRVGVDGGVGETVERKLLICNMINTLMSAMDAAGRWRGEIAPLTDDVLLMFDEQRLDGCSERRDRLRRLRARLLQVCVHDRLQVVAAALPHRPECTNHMYMYVLVNIRMKVQCSRFPLEKEIPEQALASFAQDCAERRHRVLQRLLHLF